MQLLFEKSVTGRRSSILPECDVERTELAAEAVRAVSLDLPELAEIDISRHYTALEGRTYGVNQGFYPLGSCTMKYNPRINEAAAALPGFTEIHPLQPEDTIKGCLEVLALAEKYLCELTGMAGMTFQPAAGAHGELTGILLFKKYHEQQGNTKRNKMLIPDSAHGTNPATAVMAGMEVINIPSGEDGCVDLDKLRSAVGEDTAGLMLTNPNTLGIFEKEIQTITEIVHDAGGLVYYDGANLNAIMGVVRPGDMGFDCVHLNLHKTFATPHGGGGPGCGAVGCKEFLLPYLPGPLLEAEGDGYCQSAAAASSIGKVKSFSGNFLVVVKALTYLLSLGREGIVQSAQTAVLNANYLMHKLKAAYQVVNQDLCMHEFVITMKKEAGEKHVTAMDIAKALLDHGIHPPTIYFPLIVPEALMVEPTETESKEMLDQAAEIFLDVYQKGMEKPDQLHQKPEHTVIGRADEVLAARNKKLRYHRP